MAVREHGETIEKAVAGQTAFPRATLKLHYLRWLVFDIGQGPYFMYQGYFDTDFDKYTEDAVAMFEKARHYHGLRKPGGVSRSIGKQMLPAFVKFVRDHQRPSFLEYGEYPYVTADEVKKALRVKSALSAMLDQMQ